MMVFMLKVSFFGWRGNIVGSIFMSCMIESKYLNDISPTFFSTSQVGQHPSGLMQQYGTRYKMPIFIE